MKTVYSVSCGEWDGYHVITFCLKRKNAQILIDVYNKNVGKDKHFEKAYIEKYKLFEDGDKPKYHRTWRASLSIDTNYKVHILQKVFCYGRWNFEKYFIVPPTKLQLRVNKNKLNNNIHVDIDGNTRKSVKELVEKVLKAKKSQLPKIGINIK